MITDQRLGGYIDTRQLDSLQTNHNQRKFVKDYAMFIQGLEYKLDSGVETWVEKWALSLSNLIMKTDANILIHYNTFLTII